MRSERRVDLRSKAPEPGFVPVAFWYDSPHMAPTARYLELVFAPEQVPPGGFIEDTFGHTVRRRLCEDFDQQVRGAAAPPPAGFA